MNAMDWTALLAIATVALAAGTSYLALESRRARIDVERMRRRHAFRSVLVDLADQCRVWVADDPTVNHRVAASLAAHPPRREAVDAFLGSVTVPTPVLARVLWEAAQAIGDADATLEAIRAVDPQGAQALVTLVQERLAVAQGLPPPTVDREQAVSAARSHQALTLDHLQVAACLISCEARHQGCADLADVFDALKWLKPQPGLRRVENEQQLYPLLGAPQLPEGDAYAQCSPEARTASVAMLDQERAEAARTSAQV